MQRVLFDSGYYLFCLAGLAVAAFLLYQTTTQDLSKIYTQTSGTSIAKLISSKNNVKLRPSTHPVWVRAAKELTVYERDTVFTGPNSSTVVSFDSGAKIEVSENSLIVIDKQNNQGKAEVVKGFLLVKLGGSKTKIEIKIGDVKTVIQSKTAEIQIDARKKGASAITVISGSIDISSKNKKVTLKKNQRTTISKKTEITAVETIPVALISPKWTMKYYENTKLKIPFTWNADKAFDTFKLEIAEDKEFKRRIYNKTLNKTEVYLSKILPGSYFWRVTPISENSSHAPKPSITYQFSIDKVSAPAFLRPFNNEKFVISEDLKSGRNVPVNWMKVPKASKYRLQVSKDTQFKKIIFTQEMVSPPLILNSIKQGSYHVRIQSVIMGSLSKWSKPRTFFATLGNVPDPPTLLSPRNGRLFTVNTQPTPIVMKWKKQAKVEEYILEFVEGTNFNSQTIKSRTTLTELNWTPKKSGVYTWRVLPIDKAGRTTKFSPQRKFVVSTPPPKLISPKNREIKHVKSLKRAVIIFNWSKVWAASGYSLQVSRDSSFKIPLLNRQVSSTSFAWKRPQKGTFYWRVLVQRSDIQSQTHSFQVRKRKLSAPKIKGVHRFEIETF